MLPDKTVYLVTQGESQRQAVVLERRPTERYVHYLHTDKRLDEWVPEGALEPIEAPTPVLHDGPEDGRSIKRKRSMSTEASVIGSERNQHTPHPEQPHLHYSTSPPAKRDRLTETQSKVEDSEAVIEHAKITARRNFDKVIFGRWQMKTWYFSPYPLSEDHDPLASTSAAAVASGAAGPGPSRGSRGEGRDSPGRGSPAVTGPTIRAHARTAEMMAAGLVGHHASGENSTIWICDCCFKYMRDHISWELHTKKCGVKHPPGRKVYERGAHAIWEVDGAVHKLYCQNLALFGKFFIDVKTIFFDTDHFLFYVFTDAASQRDHALGFFSKEKVSYDDWNLACIITFPPYQKKGYGMLMIEFSYELSRRSGRLGTPERPLSDLGLRSYLAYWVGVLVRFFRRVLFVGDGEPFSPGHSRRSSASRRKNVKGWHGELKEVPDGPSVAVIEDAAATFGSIRTTHKQPNPDGAATTHLSIRCTLMDIARATTLRHEDVAFAMEECGLLVRRKREKGLSSGSVSRAASADPSTPRRVNDTQGEEEGEGEPKPDPGQEIIVISREMVERVAEQRNVKPKCILDPAHVLL